MTKNGIISQNRVKAYGEVFTPDSIVNSMMDSVDNRFNPICSEKEYISKIFLEPACGDGQFLIRILYRKLEKVLKLPVEERQLYLVKALCSISGVDIQEDNVINARKRMRAIATGQPVETFDLDNKMQIIQMDLGIEYTEQLTAIIDYILNRNIICGNTLDDNNPVILTDYKFNGENVVLAECPINNLNQENSNSPETHYMSLTDLQATTSPYLDEYDF